MKRIGSQQSPVEWVWIDDEACFEGVERDAGGDPFVGEEHAECDGLGDMVQTATDGHGRASISGLSIVRPASRKSRP